MKINFYFPNDGKDARYYLDKDGLHITVYLTLNKYVGKVLHNNGVFNVSESNKKKGLYFLKDEIVQTEFPFNPDKGYKELRKSLLDKRKKLTREFKFQIQDLMFHSNINYL